LHPLGLSITSHGLGRLQEMLYLGERGVGIALVYQCVQLLDCLPDPHSRADGRMEGLAGREAVLQGLLLVLFFVQGFDLRRGGDVLAEAGFGFRVSLGGSGSGGGGGRDKDIDGVDLVRDLFKLTAGREEWETFGD